MVLCCCVCVDLHLAVVLLCVSVLVAGFCDVLAYTTAHNESGVVLLCLC